jgi:hypothetical protein
MADELAGHMRKEEELRTLPASNQDGESGLIHLQVDIRWKNRRWQ